MSRLVLKASRGNEYLLCEMLLPLTTCEIITVVTASNPLEVYRDIAVLYERRNNAIAVKNWIGEYNQKGFKVEWLGTDLNWLV